jgi:hypothetical protein
MATYAPNQFHSVPLAELQPDPEGWENGRNRR